MTRRALRLQKYRKVIPWAVSLAFAASLIIPLIALRSPIASMALSRFHLPRVAATLGYDNAAIQFEVGKYYFGGSAVYNVDRAEQAFRRALALDPEFPEAHLQLGRTLFIKGDHYHALQEIDQELELHPERWQSYYVRALVRGYRGDLHEAAEDFSRFLEHKPESWAAHNDLAWIYFRMGEYEKVKEVSIAGLRHSPGNPWLNNSLGVALLNLGDRAGAKSAFLLAKAGADNMTPELWGIAYPGNDPRLYARGLEAMRSSIEGNLALLSATSSSSNR